MRIHVTLLTPPCRVVPSQGNNLACFISLYGSASNVMLCCNHNVYKKDTIDPSIWKGDRGLKFIKTLQV